tara:strand:+ start:328 stop:468 length:141 start_codon:yes stop_codon:yes gene_type:complete
MGATIFQRKSPAWGVFMDLKARAVALVQEGQGNFARVIFGVLVSGF